MMGRHLGAKLARGWILLYADDDIIAAPRWVAEMRRCYDDADVAAASGKVLPRFEVKPPAWINLFPANYISICDAGGEYRVVERNLAFGCNMSILREVFYQVGGSYPDSMPPDLLQYVGSGESGMMQMVELTGHKIVYNPDAWVYHVIPAARLTIGFYKNRAFFQGISDSYRIIRKHGSIGGTVYPAGPQKPGIMELLRCIKHGKAKFLEYWRYMREVSIQHYSGMCYHRDQVAGDPQLLAWVLRENYLDLTEDE